MIPCATPAVSARPAVRDSIAFRSGSSHPRQGDPSGIKFLSVVHIANNVLLLAQIVPRNRIASYIESGSPATSADALRPSGDRALVFSFTRSTGISHVRRPAEIPTFPGGRRAATWSWPCLRFDHRHYRRHPDRAAQSPAAHERRPSPSARQARILQPDRQREGPYRRLDGRRHGGERQHRTFDRADRADLRKYRHRARVRGCGARLSSDPGDARFDVDRAPQDAGVARRRAGADRSGGGHEGCDRQGRGAARPNPQFGNAPAVQESGQSRDPPAHHRRGDLERHQGGGRRDRVGDWDRRYRDRRRAGAQGPQAIDPHGRGRAQGQRRALGRSARSAQNSGHRRRVRAGISRPRCLKACEKRGSRRRPAAVSGSAGSIRVATASAFTIWALSVCRHRRYIAAIRGQRGGACPRHRRAPVASSLGGASAGRAGAVGMPDTIRARAGRFRADRCASFLAKSLTVAAAWAPPRPAAAEPWLLADIDRYVSGLAQLHRHELAALALIVGVVSFAVVTAVGLVRTRSRAQRAAAADRAEIVRLREQVDRAHALLFSEPQLVIAWDARFEEPEVLGDPGIVNSVPIARRILTFATWLDADQARAMERAVEALRSRGQGFAVAATTLLGRHIEAEGRAIGGRAVLRLKEVSGVKRKSTELAARHGKLLRDVDAIRTLIEALPSPIWASDAAGRQSWVNPAYAHAVDARDGGEAVARGLELLDPAARAELAAARASGEPYAARLAVIVAGTRRIFDVFDLATRNGRAGIGIDVTEVETTRGELARTIEAHRRTLDQLPTAVAIFGADQRLTFHNAAYRALWGLTSDFLDQLPSDGAVLDQLRAARKLPEQADFRSWKNQLHEAYCAVEATEHLWHLPDGRTLRVITTPTPEGGITYLFDDVTEALELKRRYDALIRVQGETLDHLSEAVAVFGSDGRLRLFNPAFVRMWKLAPVLLAERPHIEAVITGCRPLHDEHETWQSVRGAVTGLEHRQPMSRRLERKDGSVIDCATIPLPDGATLVTFQDVTDSVNVERALRERNEALEAAYDLKNDFVHLVSYELRSPLTNIIGFAQLLEDPATGPLAGKQREYLGYITSSSASLDRK